MSRAVVAALAAAGIWTAFACAGRDAPERPPRQPSERFRDLERPIPGPRRTVDLPPLEDGDSVAGPGSRVEPESRPGATGDGTAGNRVVARLELVAPRRSPFVLHGTLPVPKGVFPRADGLSPIGVRSRGGDRPVVGAQVEVVSRYPTGEADVVEILAEVELGPRDAGRRVAFDVVLGELEVAAEPDVPGDAARLVEPLSDGPLELRARDVHGNVYTVDLRGDRGHPGFGSDRVIKTGVGARQRRTYGTLVPTERSGEGEPVPHLMGVHAYLTTWAGDERVSVDLRIHNGSIGGSIGGGRDADPLEVPAGIVYWESLELVLPSSWRAETLAPDPFLGQARVEDDRTILPLVHAYPDGALHTMGPQAQFQRRLTLFPRGLPKTGDKRQAAFLEGLAFCVPGEGLWSWSSLGRFFPQRAALPVYTGYRRGRQTGSIALREDVAAGLEELRERLAKGTPAGLVHANVMGWAHPAGVSVQGMTGGGGISTHAGHRAAAARSSREYEALMLVHRMTACRQPEAMWNRYGDPVGYRGWLREDGVVAFDFRTNSRMVPRDLKWPIFGGPEASHQVFEVHRTDRRPPYDRGTPHVAGGELVDAMDNLMAWMPHDGQHYVRWTSHAKALVWLGNDALAKDDLLHSAELFHLSFHESPHVEESWSKGVTLRAYERMAAKRPHTGLPIDREHAWGIDVACAAYSVAGPEWRELNREWLARIARFLIEIAMPNGLVQRRNHPQIVGGRYDATQSYQCMFLLHAKRCLIESVLRDVDDALADGLAEVYLRAVEYLFWGPVFQEVTIRGAYVEAGPRSSFAVALKDDRETPPFSDVEHWGEDYMPEDGYAGGVDAFYPWGALEYAAILTDGERGPGLENRYLKRALDCWIVADDYQELLGKMFADAARSSNDNSMNWAGFVALVQQHLTE